MLNWVKEIASSKEVIQLRKKVQDLENKLVESQKNIDKTNAFWKKKYYALKDSRQS